MSVGETIIAIMLFSFPHLFLAWVFVGALAAALVFFFLVFKKNTSAAVCGLTKTMTKKVRATPHSSRLWGCKPCLCCGLYFVLTTDDILLHHLATRQYYLLCILRCCLHIYALLSIAPFVNRIALTMP